MELIKDVKYKEKWEEAEKVIWEKYCTYFGV